MPDDKLTIVGTESKTSQKKVNIEALLLMAKYDDGFKKRLFENRDDALSSSGIDFSPGERLILANISDEQLLENIEEFRVPGVSKKSLTNWAKAAAVVVLLSSLAISSIGCDDRVGEPAGSHPDEESQSRPITRSGQTLRSPDKSPANSVYINTQGIAPDRDYYIDSKNGYRIIENKKKRGK